MVGEIERKFGQLKEQYDSAIDAENKLKKYKEELQEQLFELEI